MYKLFKSNVLISVVLLEIASSPTAALAQPFSPAKKTVYAVATFTANDSPNNAGNEATIHMIDWTSKGWVPMGIAAQYSEHELDAATAKGTPLWAVHILMSCMPSAVRFCRAPLGPVPPHP